MTLSKFNLRAWASNSQSPRELPQQHSVAELKEMVLGLCWNVKLDKLSLCSKPELATCTPVTKCEIVHYTSTFDPLDLVTPVTVTTKLLLQELWQDNVSWDTELNEPFHHSRQSSLLAPHDCHWLGCSSFTWITLA